MKVRLRAVSKGDELTKGGGLQRTQQEMRYALPTQRKIPTPQNRCVRAKNHAGNTRLQAVLKRNGFALLPIRFD